MSHIGPSSFTEICGEIVKLDFNRDLTVSLVISFCRKKSPKFELSASQVSEASQEILTP